MAMVKDAKRESDLYDTVEVSMFTLWHFTLLIGGIKQG